jgi:hypothetical protein
MSNIFKSIDFLGISPEFYIQGKSNYKTILGSIFSIIISILTLLSLIAFGIDLLKRESPVSVLSTEYLKTPVINGKDLFFTIAPMFPGGRELTEIDRKLTIQMNFADTDGGRKVNITQYSRFDLVSCSKSTKFKKLNISNYLVGVERSYYCTPDDFERDLIGKFGDATFTLYQLEIT